MQIDFQERERIYRELLWWTKSLKKRSVWWNEHFVNFQKRFEPIFAYSRNMAFKNYAYTLGIHVSFL